jgi:hypothetical protein
MIKKILRNIVVMIVMISNLAFMCGFIINHHICMKTNKEISSIFITSKCDHNEHNSCSSNNNESEDEELPACCKHNSEHQKESPEICNDQIESCCYNTSEYISIDDSYIYSNRTIILSNDIISEIQKSESEKILTNTNLVLFKEFNDLNFNNHPQIFNISFIHNTSLPLV